MHAYRTHTCGATAQGGTSARRVRLSGWVNRRRDHGGLLFIDLRDHYGITQCVIEPDVDRLRRGRQGRSEWVVTHHRRGRRAHGRDRQQGPADRRGRNPHRGDRDPDPGAGTAAAGLRRARLSGGDAAEIPLPRSAPRAAAPQHHAALEGHLVHPPAHDRPGLHRVPDADPDRVVARRRARLPRAVAPASRQVLCAAAGAAAVQAAHHGGGLRPLLPDRALFPRRGCARRPLARASSISSIWR